MIFSCGNCEFVTNDKEIAYEHKLSTGHKIYFAEERIVKR